MAKRNRNDRRLALKRETLRKLETMSDEQLRDVGGGIIDRNAYTDTCCCRGYWG